MNAARIARPARAVLTAALLCSIAACTRVPERQEAAAAPPAVTPDYMTTHIARDAALSDALIGNWSESVTGGDGTPFEQVSSFAADRTLSVFVSRRDKPDERSIFKGTWSVAQGFLTYRLTQDGSNKSIDGSEEILRIDKAQLVYVDGDDKKTKIAARIAPGNLAAMTPPASPPAPPAALTPAQTVAVTASPADTPFVDDTLFVAGDDVGVHAFRVNETAQIQLSVEIDEKVPVNVIVQRGKVAPEEYLMGLGALMVGQVFARFDDGKGEKASTTNDLFKSRLSKRAAYGRFDSPWVTLKEGTYTVILDNSGELSPSRGDAPVHLRLYSRPVQ